MTRPGGRRLAVSAWLWHRRAGEVPELDLVVVVSGGIAALARAGSVASSLTLIGCGGDAGRALRGWIVGRG